MKKLKITVRIDASLKDKVDYVKQFPCGLSGFIAKKFEEVEISPRKLLELSQMP